MRQRVLRLNAVANRIHSAATLTRPRSKNRRAPCCSLMMPKTGSINCFLRLDISCASRVDIQVRWRRNTASWSPTVSARPFNRSLVHTPKAGQAWQVAAEARYTRLGLPLGLRLAPTGVSV